MRKRTGDGDPAGAQRLAEVAAVRVGQADVDDQDIRHAGLDAREQLRSAADRVGVESLLAEAAPKHRAQLVVVLDDQHPGAGHSASSMAPISRSGGMCSGGVQTADTTLPPMKPATAKMLNKVPEVTLYFWIIKVLCTTVGETAADYLNVNLEARPDRTRRS